MLTHERHMYNMLTNRNFTNPANLREGSFEVTRVYLVAETRNMQIVSGVVATVSPEYDALLASYMRPQQKLHTCQACGQDSCSCLTGEEGCHRAMESGRCCSTTVRRLARRWTEEHHQWGC